MAEDEHTIYDLDVVKAELRRKTVHRTCAGCDGDLWEVPGDRLAVLHSIDPDTHSIDFTGPVTIVLPLVCVNCGFVRLHAPNFLLSDRN